MDNVISTTLTTSQAAQLFWLVCFSEFVGTAVLILLGNGVCASTSYKKMFANQPGKWILIIMGWGFAVLVGALVSTMMGGAGHLNPAVTIFDAIKMSQFVGRDVNTYSQTIYYYSMVGHSLNLSASIALTFFIFIFFQMTGAISGQLILNFINLKFLKDTENELSTIRGTHCTGPAYSNKEDKATIQNFLYEFIGTLVLIGFILGTGHTKISGVNLGPLTTLPVAFVVMSIGLSLGSATGYAINPARDLGPRIAYVLSISKIRKSDWDKSTANWCYSWIPVVAPMIASMTIGLLSLLPNISNGIFI